MKVEHRDGIVYLDGMPVHDVMDLRQQLLCADTMAQVWRQAHKVKRGKRKGG